MTAAIAGLTFIAAGPHTHQKRWVHGMYVTWCAATDGPCQGHGTPTTAPTTTDARPWCPKGLHQGEMVPRADKAGVRCRACERDRERARRSPAYDRRREPAPEKPMPPHRDCEQGHERTRWRRHSGDGRWRLICRDCNLERKHREMRRAA